MHEELGPVTVGSIFAGSALARLCAKHPLSGAVGHIENWVLSQTITSEAKSLTGRPRITEPLQQYSAHPEPSNMDGFASRLVMAVNAPAESLELKACHVASWLWMLPTGYRT